jgi:hypothetical protein
VCSAYSPGGTDASRWWKDFARADVFNDMRRKGTTTTQQSPEVIDEMLECYIEWREYRAAVQDAYDVWHIAPVRDRERAFHSYVAALDREQVAAEDYQRAAEHAAAA